VSRDYSEVGQLYNQKLQNFEGSLNMASVFSSEYPNKKVLPYPKMSSQA
jgi:hypothetical protein